MKPLAWHSSSSLVFPPTRFEDEEARTHLLIHLAIENGMKTECVSGGPITPALIPDRGFEYARPDKYISWIGLRSIR
jgi:hypothetical protein